VTSNVTVTLDSFVQSAIEELSRDGSVEKLLQSVNGASSTLNDQGDRII
jgi:hypothetical protein